MTDCNGNEISVGDTVIQDSWGYSGATAGNCGSRSEVFALGRTRVLIKVNGDIRKRWVSINCICKLDANGRAIRRPLSSYGETT